MNLENMKIATLFGGAMNNIETDEYKQTVEIGRILAKHGYIVKNGGYRGMMEAVSKGIFEEGGIAVGFTVESFGSTTGNEYLTYNFPQKDLFDRLRKLIENTELFIVQKGGIGTIAELMLCLDVVRKVKKNKPKILLIGSFWHDIMEPMKSLMHTKEHGIFKILNDFEEFQNEIL